ncbi:DUF4405 domain-containing protein [Flavobacteriaceae bacterium F08102]|nr:DUF4405 domain-containing protein [Flavobacteriaceae bacterium F08102]
MKKSSQNLGKASKTRVILDLFFFSIIMVVLIPQSTGIPLHEWISFIVLIPFFFHLMVNWSWIASQTKNLFKKRLRKTKFDYFFNWILYIVMLLVTVSGIVISESALPSIGIYFTINPFWIIIHNASATVFMALLGIHLALHWRWILITFKKFQWKSDFYYAKQILKILQHRKKELLLLGTLSILLSLGIWGIERTDWAENITLNSSQNKTEASNKLSIPWLVYVLPLIKVSVLLCVPGILTRLMIHLKVKLKN